MSVNCVLVDERGKEPDRVADPSGLMNTLIQPLAAADFQCWRFIDEYGDTVFNTLQMPRFLEEAALIRERSSGEAINILAEVERLARRCQAEIHTYLRFIGD